MTEPTSVWSMSLTAFRDAVAEHSTPGCGAAAAVTANLGLALVVKGLTITRSPAGDEKHRALTDKANVLVQELSDVADRDARAFENYLDATELPRDSEAEDVHRRRALDDAARQINAIPLISARLCLSALRLAEESLLHTSQGLLGDTIAGGLLIHAGLSSALLNVDANLASLPDQAERKVDARQRLALQEDADRLIKVLLAHNRP